jgi:hypothetical protein
MSGTTAQAAERGLSFLNMLLENYAGHGLNHLVTSGAHPAAIAVDIKCAYDLLQGIKIATGEEHGKAAAGDTPTAGKSKPKRKTANNG